MESNIEENSKKNNVKKESNIKKQNHIKSVGLPPGLLSQLLEIQNFCVAQEYSIKPKLSSVLAVSFPELKDTDFKRIYKNLLTPEDKLNIEHQRYNKDNDTNTTLTEFVCLRLKLH